MATDTTTAAHRTPCSAAARRRLAPMVGHGAAVVAYIEGDQWALHDLMTSFDTSMRRVARRFLPCAHDVDDAVQEAWLSFTRAASTIREPGAVGGWLCVTTARAAVSIARRNSRTTTSGVTELFERMPIFEPGFDQILLVEELAAVRAAAARLDERDRRFVELLFSGDLSYAEVARRVDRSIGGIGPTRQRVTAKLRSDPAIQRLVAARTA